MAFDDSVISGLTLRRRGGDMVASWVSSAPAGTTFQVYLSGQLAWAGTATKAFLPYPPGGGWVQAGAVGPGEARTDFSGTLTAPSRRKALVPWLGGTYLSETIQGFRVYQGPGPGQPPDMTAPAADVAAYPHGSPLDGFGRGGYGRGGYGRSASNYSWTSDPLTSGVWHFKVTSYDRAGNEDLSSAVPYTVTLAVPPPTPPPAATGSRVAGAYSAGSGTATLNWTGGSNGGAA